MYQLMSKIALIGIASVNIAVAQQLFHRYEFGQIQEIAISDSSFPNRDFISLKGDTAPLPEPTSCFQFASGITPYRVRDDAKGNRMMAAAVMAKAAGIPILIGVTKDNRDGEGVCFADLLVVNPDVAYELGERSLFLNDESNADTDYDKVSRSGVGGGDDQERILIVPNYDEIIGGSAFGDNPTTEDDPQNTDREE